MSPYPLYTCFPFRHFPFWGLGGWGAKWEGFLGKRILLSGPALNVSISHVMKVEQSLNTHTCPFSHIDYLHTVSQGPVIKIASFQCLAQKPEIPYTPTTSTSNSKEMFSQHFGLGGKSGQNTSMLV